jgi:hypothetical protein
LFGNVRDRVSPTLAASLATSNSGNITRTVGVRKFVYVDGFSSVFLGLFCGVDLDAIADEDNLKRLIIG